MDLQGLGILITAIFAGLTSLAVGILTIFFGNKSLRARIEILKARVDARDQEMAEVKARHEADNMAIRRVHGDAINAGIIQREMIQDDLTALALHSAERDLELAEAERRMEHYANEIERITGTRPSTPPHMLADETRKILSKSGIYSVTPDPDAKSEGRIFLVEDHPDLRRQVSAYLRKSGYEVFTAATVAEAKREIEAWGKMFNLVLLDLMLLDSGNGHVGGDAVAEYMHDRGIRAPIIITTAMGIEEARHYIKKLKAVGCVCKPYQYPQLIAAICEHIRSNP